MMRELKIALYTVFRNAWHTIGAAVGAYLFFFFAVWVKNFTFLWFFLTSPSFTLWRRLKIFEWTWHTFVLNFSPLRMGVTLLLSLLTGITFSMLIFYMRARAAAAREAGIGLAGVVIGTLGIGCASCGSVLITALFGYAATAGFLGALPLQGIEFGVMGIALLVITIFFLSRRIASGEVCEIPQAERRKRS